MFAALDTMRIDRSPPSSSATSATTRGNRTLADTGIELWGSFVYSRLDIYGFIPPGSSSHFSASRELKSSADYTVDVPSPHRYKYKSTHPKRHAKSCENRPDQIQKRRAQTPLSMTLQKRIRQRKRTLARVHVDFVPNCENVKHRSESERNVRPLRPSFMFVFFQRHQSHIHACFRSHLPTLHQRSSLVITCRQYSL